MLADKKNEWPGQKESPFHLTLPSPNTAAPPPNKKKWKEIIELQSAAK